MIEIILFSLLAVIFFLGAVLYYIDYTITISSRTKARIIPGQEENAYKRVQKNHLGSAIIAACAALALVLNVRNGIVYTVALLVYLCFIGYVHKEQKKYFK